MQRDRERRKEYRGKKKHCIEYGRTKRVNEFEGIGIGVRRNIHERWGTIERNSSTASSCSRNQHEMKCIIVYTVQYDDATIYFQRINI